jgi:hypothetical protein
MGDVFKEGVDDIYEPMAEFADIPPPLYEQLDGASVDLSPAATEEVLSANYQYFEDQEAMQESGD